jgi:presenilin-like A22 family membrane protease
MSTESDTVESGRVALPVENVLSTIGVWALFATTILAGVALTDSVLAAGLEAQGRPSSFDTLGTFIATAAAGILVFLLVQRYDLGRRLLQLGFGAYLAWLTGSFLSVWVGLSLPIGVALGTVVPAVLYLYPEWYVMNAACVYWGAALIAILGVSFAPQLAVVVLVAWAAYDAYAVYRSDAMKTLATASADMSIPGAFYVPTAAGASLRDGHPLADGVDDEGDADDDDGNSNFKLLGVGDPLIPGLLVVSATQFLSADPVVWMLNAPAAGAFAGALVGLLGLQVLVRRLGGMHAGLPVLNAATLAGYLAGALAAGLTVSQALGL